MKTDVKRSIPQIQSNAEEWISWHKELKAYFGKKDANTIFVKAWSTRGGVSSVANTTELRKYLSENGIQISKDGLASFIDGSFGVFDTIGDIFKIGATGSIVVIGGSVLLVGAIIWRLTKSESIGTIIKYAK
jgi:hypothetical protein